MRTTKDFLFQVFSDLLSVYRVSDQEIKTLWLDIETNYSQPSRFYHDLTHIQDMILALEPVKQEINNYDLVKMAVFYHDIIYIVTSKSNEEKSAAFAVNVLEKIGASESDTKIVADLILATKYHELSQDSDTNYLLDADLHVLGKLAVVYNCYAKNIRKEYGIYPNFLYNPGRKKVLQHFLNLASVFKTPYFIDKYEKTAQENLQTELNCLCKK